MALYDRGWHAGLEDEAFLASVEHALGGCRTDDAEIESYADFRRSPMDINQQIGTRAVASTGAEAVSGMHDPTVTKHVTRLGTVYGFVEGEA